MYSIQFPWKSFKVHLPDLHEQLKGLSSEYTGNSADKALTLWFSSEPSLKVKDLIQEKWESLSETEEAQKIEGHEIQEAAIELAKANIPHEDIFKLIPAERKMMMNQPLNPDDRRALAQKYIK